MKLWQKENTSISKLIENFTVGRDKDFDRLLAKYDVQGSIAHVKMLGEVGLMTNDEAQSAIAGLEQILAEINNSSFNSCSTSSVLRANGYFPESIDTNIS